MVMKVEDNDLLTRVGPGTPMGELLRQYWTPAIRSSALVADGAPVAVRLFGQDFVAFRATDGRAGIIDAACPHRQVSMLLARNEDNGLRCIFHGWKFDVTGKVVDAPCEPQERRERFCAAVKTNRYGVREAAGVVWVYLGGGAPPAFPEFEFMGLPPDRLVIRRAVVPYNWLQGLEAHVDSSHVAFLHRGFLTQDQEQLEPSARANLALMGEDTAPKFETQTEPYGMREGALRTLGDKRIYARIREIALPFVTFIPGPEEGPYGGRMSVPIDDETSAEWYIIYDPHRPLSADSIRTNFHNTSPDPDDFAANLPTAQEGWKQDRDAMKKGHFSGLTINLSFEDFIAQASMGRRIDRSREQLGSADLIIVKVRKELLDAVHQFQVDKTVPWRDDVDFSSIRARSVTYEAGEDWRSFPGVPESEVQRD